MLMRLTVIFVSGLLFSGCATSAETGIGHVNANDERNCNPGQGDRPPVVKQVTIKLREEEIVVAPPRVCVRPGDVLKFQLIDNLDKNNVVSVSGKDVGDDWIKGGNKGKKSIFFVLVPLDLLPESIEDPERVYYYNVSVDDKTKDPEVRVKRNYY